MDMAHGDLWKKHKNNDSIVEFRVSILNLSSFSFQFSVEYWIASFLAMTLAYNALIRLRKSSFIFNVQFSIELISIS